MLVFLEITSRRVVFCNATSNPDSAWVAQQARNVAWELEELKIPITVLIREWSVMSSAGDRLRQEGGGSLRSCACRLRSEGW